MSEQEKEVKYYVNRLKDVENRIIKLGASLIQPRTFEFNLLFDNGEEALSNNFQYLRLRRDSLSRLTFKGAAEIIDGVNTRKEIEIEVSSFETTKSLLEALDYRVILIYEKYRTTYKKGKFIITLDEMPFGDFVEIEGIGSQGIKEISIEIGLNWEERILRGYLNLYKVVVMNAHRKFDNLTFSDFAGIIITPEILDVNPADM